MVNPEKLPYGSWIVQWEENGLGATYAESSQVDWPREWTEKRALLQGYFCDNLGRCTSDKVAQQQ